MKKSKEVSSNESIKKKEINLKENVNFLIHLSFDKKGNTRSLSISHRYHVLTSDNIFAGNREKDFRCV